MTNYKFLTIKSYDSPGTNKALNSNNSTGSERTPNIFFLTTQVVQNV